jgi:hypothetical protein
MPLNFITYERDLLKAVFVGRVVDDPLGNLLQVFVVFVFVFLSPLSHQCVETPQPR